MLGREIFITFKTGRATLIDDFTSLRDAADTQLSTVSWFLLLLYIVVMFCACVCLCVREFVYGLLPDFK